MAADFEKLSACENNKTNNKCYKSFGGSRIRCKSRTNLSNDTDTILSEVEQIINRNAHWSDDEKDRFRKRFREIYMGIIERNVAVDRENTSFDSEAEMLDEAQWNLLDSLLTATDKRKRYPRMCVRQLALQYKNECKFIAGQTIGISTNRETALLEQGFITQETKNIYHDACKSLSNTSPLLAAAVSKTEQLQKSEEMRQKMCFCKTDRFIFSPHQDETKVEDSLTPLIKRMKQQPPVVNPQITHHGSVSTQQLTQSTDVDYHNIHRKGYKLDVSVQKQNESCFYKKI